MGLGSGKTESTGEIETGRFRLGAGHVSLTRPGVCEVGRKGEARNVEVYRGGVVWHRVRLRSGVLESREPRRSERSKLKETGGRARVGRDTGDGE
jgi:hypothetical protein